MYDYVIVGAGLFGATCAYLLKGKKILVIDSKGHVAGNCYTEEKEGIHVHMYGPHIFHTSNKSVWEFVNKFAHFNNFVNRPKAFNNGRLYSLPINLTTLAQVYGVRTPQEATIRLQERVVKLKEPQNLEEFCLSEIGPELYNLLIRDYTRKQWQTDPKNLPAEIIKRLPVRLTYDDNYYDSKYQGIPEEGYTHIVKKLLEGVTVALNTDFFDDRLSLKSISRKIIYTGPIDRYFDYQFGELEYRTNRFEHERISKSDYQGNAIVNYCDMSTDLTRIIEHKHFTNFQSDYTYVTRDYPDSWDKSKTPMYPINTVKNNAIYKRYKDLASKEQNVLFGGRLATYQYLDMHQIINQAMVLCKSL